MILRHEAGTELRALMSSHLDAEGEEWSRPPAVWRAVRDANGRYAIHRPAGFLAWVADIAFLVFDSSRLPFPVGVRGAGTSSRRFLFRAGRRLVKVRLEHPAGCDRLLLVGQIVDKADPRKALADLPVLVLSGKRAVTGTLTNRLGEFELEFEPASSLRLSVGIPGRRPVTVPLPPGGEAAADGGVTRGRSEVSGSGTCSR